MTNWARWPVGKVSDTTGCDVGDALAGVALVDDGRTELSRAVER
jgi:hypothetical protein